MQALYDAIVIGAGISGTAAANYLAQNKFKILILQGQDYIGGRTKTSQVMWPLKNLEVQYDQGASWLHEYSTDHPLSKYIKKVGIELAYTDYENMKIYDDKGKDQTWNYDYQKYESFMGKVHKHKGLTVKQAIIKKKQSMLKDPMFMNYLASEYEGSSAADMSELAANSEDTEDYSKHEECQKYQEKKVKKGKGYEYEGGQMYVANGYNKVAESLVKNQNINVKLSRSVVSIRKQPNQTFSTVSCSNGEKYEAKTIICSVPLGVLKKNLIKFEPQLPALKLQAISSIGFGHLYKTFILVNKPYQKLKEHVFMNIDTKIEDRGFAPIIYNLQAFAGKPGFVAFMTGNKANFVQKMDDDQFLRLLARKMSVILKVELQGKDLTVRRSTWLSNKHFNGTYTFYGVDTRYHHFRQIAKPIFENQWYFCGEHTHGEESSTTYGAYSSGIRTAKDIVSKANESNWKYESR